MSDGKSCYQRFLEQLAVQPDQLEAALHKSEDQVAQMLKEACLLYTSRSYGPGGAFRAGWACRSEKMRGGGKRVSQQGAANRI